VYKVTFGPPDDVTLEAPTHGGLIDRAMITFDSADTFTVEYRAGTPYLVVRQGGNDVTELSAMITHSSQEFRPGEPARLRADAYGQKKGAVVAVDRMVKDKPGMMYVSGYSRMVDVSKFEKVN
jgi:hypothetical protein